MNMCVIFIAVMGCVHVFLYWVLNVTRVWLFGVLPLGWPGGSHEASRVWGPVPMTLGGGWFCGGAEAVSRDKGRVEVQPPEEHACRESEVWT